MEKKMFGSIRPIKHLNLGELIEQLKETLNQSDEPEKMTVYFDFAGLSPELNMFCDRGWYQDLAIPHTTTWEFPGPTLLADLIKFLEGEIGKEYTAYKGGEYEVDERRLMWVAHWGECPGTMIIGVRDDGYQAIILTTHAERGEYL